MGLEAGAKVTAHDDPPFRRGNRDTVISDIPVKNSRATCICQTSKMERGQQDDFNPFALIHVHVVTGGSYAQCKCNCDQIYRFAQHACKQYVLELQAFMAPRDGDTNTSV